MKRSLTHKLELLAPAGSPEALDAAIGEGADAVYLGLKSFNARMRSANFAFSQFEGALKNIHRMGKKVYVTVNTVFEQREGDRMYQLLRYLSGIGPDALIVQDFGVLKMVQDNFPSLKLHASTQMNIASGRGANALSRYGVSRVVLARELGLEEIRNIRANTNLELECFVHGALCISVSGLCLFSSYLGGKSANRGMCTQACRRIYRQDNEQGYYFSPSDLELLEKIPDLARAGVGSFKIEGRMKSAEYVGAVTAAYRRIIDAVLNSNLFDSINTDGMLKNDGVENAIHEARNILKNDFARSKTRYLFESDSPKPEAIDWLNPAQSGGTGINLGAILKIKGSGEKRRALLGPGNGTPMPAAGDSIRLHKADDSMRLSHKLTSVEEADEQGQSYWLSVPEGFETGDLVYLTQTRTMSKRYAQVIPRNLDPYKRKPGQESAPPAQTKENNPGNVLPEHAAGRRMGQSSLPAGFYVVVSGIEDMYIVQSDKPVKLILSLNRKTFARLIENKQPLPFKPEEIILTLDPFFPQSEEAFLGEAAALLSGKGYRFFMLNNPGHFSLFRDTGAGKVLIAGPWLYTFNRWAAAFVSSLGASYVVSPLENNRQNLEKTMERSIRSSVFVPVFAWPPLFRIRSDLGTHYGFGEFAGLKDELFSLKSNNGGKEDPSGSFVIPEQPFSIVDKIPFLMEANFHRFIFDFSLTGHSLKKKDYRDIMKAAKKGLSLPGCSRFNWKNGFYQETEYPAEKEMKGRGTPGKPGPGIPSISKTSKS
ncbi:MAG: U32 family peptidase [Treponema sp.]|nr:U32 family peptidase [Treponema sp.]